MMDRWLRQKAILLIRLVSLVNILSFVTADFEFISFKSVGWGAQSLWNRGMRLRKHSHCGNNGGRATKNIASSSTSSLTSETIFLDSFRDKNFALNNGRSSPSVIPASLRTQKKKKKVVPHSIVSREEDYLDQMEKSHGLKDGDEENESDVSKTPLDWVVKGITQPLIPREIWENEKNLLTGTELYDEEVMESLARTGIQMAEDDDNGVDWTPADKATADASSHDNLQEAMLEDGQVLIWTGNFREKEGGYGSDLSLVKTKSVLPVSPRSFAELLMDSSKVPLYNKISLGRSDEKFLIQQNDKEAKIVRNLSKPPISKRTLEFFTFMHFRKLLPGEVQRGILGGGVSSSEENDQDEEIGYLVMSRAVNGGIWSPKKKEKKKTNANKTNSRNKEITTRGGGSTENIDNDDDDDNEEKDNKTPLRCEILLGVNIIRNIPGHPDKTEVTAVTHVKSAKVPKMLATKFSVNGALNFIQDIRNIYP